MFVQNFTPDYGLKGISYELLGLGMWNFNYKYTYKWRMNSLDYFISQQFGAKLRGSDIFNENRVHRPT
jgi:hypothetical protein